LQGAKRSKIPTIPVSRTKGVGSIDVGEWVKSTLSALIALITIVCAYEKL
jgi:hypothetical protein